jgi:hypothetical protein
MKMGPFDGRVEEVGNLLENNGLRIEDYLEKPPAPLKTRFLVIPAVLFGVSVCAMAALPIKPPVWLLRLVYILSFGSATWVCASTQIRFRNGIATFCVAMGLILTALLAAGLLSPKEAADMVKDLKGK